jgi:hypothetical protein
MSPTAPTRRVAAIVAALSAVALIVFGLASPAQADDPGQFTTVGTATVSGQPYVGDCLTAEEGTWDPTPDAFEYQWLRAGSPIPGATSRRYTPTSDDLGSSLSVTVTATKSGYSDTPTTSTASADIQQPGALDSSQPTISGDPEVGSPLIADAGDWGPGPVDLSYSWMSDGSVVQEGASTTYTPTASDVDKSISVRVKGSEPAYATTTSTSDPTAAVAAGRLSTDTPVISGNTTVGSTLSAAAGNWGPGTVTFDYAWSSGGTQVQDGPSSSYTLVGSDAGNTVTVKVTGTEPGFTPASRSSAQTAVIATGTLTTTPAPTITGTAAVGSTLTANTGTWGPGTVSFDYDWFSNGQQVQDGASPTYVPSISDIGNTITVTATGSETGYADAFETSSATSAVVQGTLTSDTPTISGSASVGSTLTGIPGNWGPTPVSFDYKWSTGTTVLQDSASPTYVVQASDSQNVITLTVTASKAGYGSVTASPVSTAPIALGTLSPTPTPTITGNAIVGSPLSANAGTWGPGTVNLTYTWMSGANILQQGSGPTYTPSPSDVGTTITVTVTGTETGYSSASVTSTATSQVVKGTLTVSPQPSISGTPTFTQILTANAPASNWGPGTVTLSYQWLLNGAAISGQTGQTYTPAATDVGKAISLQVTGSENGYTTLTSTSGSVTISPATFAATAAPMISGPSSIGHILTAVTTGWSPTPDFVYQWFRDGVSEPGVSGEPSTYQLTPDDFDHTITLKITGVKAGYTSVTPSQVASNGPIAHFTPTFTAFPTPVVSGTYKVGSQLSVSTGAWTPTPDSFSYTWQRGTGDPNASGNYTTIQNALNSTYTLQPADLGLSVIVRVTANKQGYTSKTEPSDESDAVTNGALTPGTPTVSGTAQVGQSLTVSPGTWLPAGVSFEYVWLSGGTVLQDSTSSVYTPVATDVGHQILVNVIGTEAGYDPNNQNTSATAPVIQGQFSSTPAPTITGTASPGATLTATVPAWTPTTTFTYAWAIDGTPITGQTDSTLVVPAAAAGHSVTVTATSTKPGYKVVNATSAPTPIAQLQFGTPPKPTISGTAKVGGTLTAKPGTWTPVTPTFTYQWTVSGSSPDTTDTASTFVPTADDLGHTITVTVTGSAAGYADRTSAASSATAKVVVGSLTTATPVISDTTPTVDQAGGISVSPGAWTPGTSFTYQWYRSSTAISGATSSSYFPGASDSGKTLKVKVTGKLTGYTNASVTSKATTAVKAGSLTTATPTISGIPAVGSKLTAVPGTWGPSPVTFKYQWYRGSTAISGATSSTYTLTTASLGKTLKVKVTGSKAGYTSVALTSAATSAVVKGDFTSAPTPTITGTPAVGSKLTAAHGTWAPSTSLTYKYQWCRGDTSHPIAGKTGSTYTLVAADAGSAILVVVTVSKTDYNTTAKTSAPTATIID